MDVGRAFGFVFDDEEWIKKILIGGGVSLIPIVGTFLIYGYMLEIIRRIYTADAEELPDWEDFGGYLVRGLLFFVALLIWFLPVILLITCVAIAIAIAGGSANDDTVAAFTGLTLFALFGLLFVLIALWGVVALPIISGRYAVERQFGSMFQFGEIMRDIRVAGAGPILMLFVVYLVSAFIGQLGFILCLIGVIFTSFYANVVVAHGAGQVYRRARGLPPAPTVTTVFG